MTEGGKRRDGILSLLEESDIPLSGTELAHRFKVSRQVIVQDIALLRAEDKKILSTYRDMFLNGKVKKRGNVSGCSASAILPKIPRTNFRPL